MANIVFKIPSEIEGGYNFKLNKWTGTISITSNSDDNNFLSKDIEIYENTKLLGVINFDSNKKASIQIHNNNAIYTLKLTCNDFDYIRKVTTQPSDATGKTYSVTNLTNKPINWADSTTSHDANDEIIKDMINRYYTGDLTLEVIKQYWSVGQDRCVNLQAIPAISGFDNAKSTQKLQMRIIGFEHDELVTPRGDKTKALITVQPYYTLNSTGAISDVQDGSWKDSRRRQWLQYEYYNALPTFYQEMMQEIKYETINEDDTIETISDKIFLLSPTEVNLSGTNIPILGSVYEYYSSASGYRIKNIGPSSTTKAIWWLRSHNIGAPLNFNVINSSGSVTAYAETTLNTAYICPACCL